MMAPEPTADCKVSSVFRATDSRPNLLGQNLLGLTRGELEQFAVSCGQPRFRGAQIYHGIYNRRERDFARLTDLGRGFREFLASHCSVAYPTVEREFVSRDGSVRYLLGLEDGSASEAGCGVALRRITISTSGIVPRIYDLGREPVRPNLAVSLNASTDEQRTALMPINRKYPLRELLEACRAYPLRPRERLTFEYVMLDGLNDSEADAARLAALLGGIPSRVNLIPYNPGEGLPYRPSPLARVLKFQQALKKRQVPAFIRISRGRDIMAACGQLSLADRLRPQLQTNAESLKSLDRTSPR